MKQKDGQFFVYRVIFRTFASRFSIAKGKTAMTKIKNEAAYQAALRRVEQLEELVNDDNSVMDDNAMELDMLVDMIEEYEDIHYPIGKKLR